MRLVIEIQEAQHVALKAMCAELGTTQAALVRELIDLAVSRKLKVETVVRPTTGRVEVAAPRGTALAPKRGAVLTKDQLKALGWKGDYSKIKE